MRRVVVRGESSVSLDNNNNPSERSPQKPLRRSRLRRRTKSVTGTTTATAVLPVQLAILGMGAALFLLATYIYLLFGVTTAPSASLSARLRANKPAPSINNIAPPSRGRQFPPAYPKVTRQQPHDGSTMNLSKAALDMCTKTLWHTLETTTIVLPDGDTFIHTGDIDDLWLRVRLFFFRLGLACRGRVIHYPCPHLNTAFFGCFAL